MNIPFETKHQFEIISITIKQSGIYLRIPEDILRIFHNCIYLSPTHTCLMWEKKNERSNGNGNINWTSNKSSHEWPTLSAFSSKQSKENNSEKKIVNITWIISYVISPAC